MTPPSRAPGAPSARQDWAALARRLTPLIRSRLRPKRLRHTLGVARTARDLALSQGLDPAKAGLAGLLHDCAKGLDRGESERLLKRLRLDPLERALPALWHAPLGALLARSLYGIQDREILEAIRFHSTGSPRLGALGRILYVADFIEPGRDFPGLGRLRGLARENFSKALKGVVAGKISFLAQKGMRIHPVSVQFYNSLLESGSKIPPKSPVKTIPK